MDKSLTFLIADDHPIFRTGLKELIITQNSTVNVEQVTNGQEVIDYLENHVPDVTILDVDMPEKDGLEACKHITENNIPTKVVVLTMYNDSDIFNAALDAGADAFVLKENSGSDLVVAIDSVLAGQMYISTGMREHFNNRGNYIRRKKLVGDSLSELTQTELKTLKLVSENYSSKEIGDLLFVTAKSVDNYRSRICKKLGLSGGNNALMKWVYQNKELLKQIDS